MAFSYSRIAATALRLVTKYGTLVSLVKLGTTPSDPTKPHLGPLDPRSSPTATLALVPAVFVEPSDTSKLGIEVHKVDYLKRATKIAICANPADLADYHELVDADGTTWRILGVSTLRPGPTTLLHFVGLAR